MDGQLLIKIVLIIFGLAMFFGGVFYSKKDHEKSSTDGAYSSSSDSIVWMVVMLLFGIFLSIGPWWLSKTIFILLGAGLIYVSIFLI
ncbi:hypothetical protein ON064_12230 [Planococcus sp. A6]|uniref:hypothetical protein n=1 Tax=Planococcus sp. A6 TaxID=2992760 RepID=UPI00237AE88F|nr:hypothetical protein [Planococcus sp. A6]MDE0583798.1 hypothetical protein [Planococcus sp. A6]